MRFASHAILLLILFVAALAAAPAQAQLAFAPGDKVPELAGWTTGGEVEMVEWKKLNLLNYWATWCEPCKQEMPALQALHERYADKGLQVLGLVTDVQITLDKVTGFIEDIGIEYPVLRPHEKYFKAWGGVGAIPTTYLIDSEGRLLRKYVGARAIQVDGMIEDVIAALEGRPLGEQVIPSGPSAVH